MSRILRLLPSLLLIFFSGTNSCFAQTFPLLGPEIPVTINGLATDAMEPFLSPDGNTLFYNSLNDGQTTSLYWAGRLNDTTFTLNGLMTGGCNQSVSPRMNAVASLDSAGHFFWLSLRNYPSIFQNYMRGLYTNGSVSDTGHVYGNIYVYSPGWLIMDAAINYQGNLFYYCNAYFNNCNGLPCKAMLGIGQKLNDSTFAKLSNSDTLLAQINDTSYVVYAPQVSSNGLELYYTRFNRFSPIPQTEICLALRNNTLLPFGTPQVIITSANVPEAPTISTDMTRLYYHHKDTNGKYRIYMRYRLGPASVAELNNPGETLHLFPNPANDRLYISLSSSHEILRSDVLSEDGRTIFSSNNCKIIDTSILPKGLYLLRIETKSGVYFRKFIKAY